ncbi:MAG: hypothetical protein ACXWBN_10000 [Acidimicrobiales bacterium]
MNIYELFGLVLVAGMVVMLIIAARSLGDHDRRVERPTGTSEEREKSKA